MLSQGNRATLTAGERAGRLVWVIAACGLVCSTLWAVSTFVIARPALPFWGVIMLFVGVFPVHLRTARGLQRGKFRWPWQIVGTFKAARTYLTGVELAVVAGCFFAFWLIALSSIHGLSPGQPEIDHGLYYANDHGTLTRISKSEYDHLQLLAQRLFTAVPAAFYLVAVAYGLGAERYRRRRSAPA